MARPSSLTDEAVARYVQATTAGAFPEQAARFAGFSPRALYRYLRGSTPAHAAFRDAALRAENELEIRLAGTIVRAGMNEPRWALEMLARRFPERWARRPGDAPIEADPGSRGASEPEVILDPALVDAIVPKLLEAGERLRGAGEIDQARLGRFESRSPGAPDDQDRAR